MPRRTPFGRRLRFEALRPRLVLDAAMGGDLLDCDPAAAIDVGLEDAAVDVSVQFSNVDGKPRIPRHEDEIDVLQCSGEMGPSSSFHVGGGGGAGFHVGGGGGAGKVGVHDFVFTEFVDKASTPLMPVGDGGSVDFNLVSRLMKQDGMDNSFKHEEGKHHVDAVLVGSVRA